MTDPDGDVETTTDPEPWEPGGAAADPTGESGLDAAGVVVGVLLAVAGSLFVLQAPLEYVVVGPVGVRPVVLSAAVLALAMLAGGVLFGLAGRRTLAVGHGGTGVGWTLVLAGTVGGYGPALVLGAGVVGGTTVFLVADYRRSRSRGR